MPRAFSDMAGGIDSKSSDVENLTWWLLVYIVSPQRLPLFLMFKVLQHPIQMERIAECYRFVVKICTRAVRTWSLKLIKNRVVLRVFAYVLVVSWFPVCKQAGYEVNIR